MRSTVRHAPSSLPPATALRARRLAALPAILVLAACGSNGGPAGPMPVSVVIATGVVRDAGGAPVAGAPVTMYAYATCSDSLIVGAGDPSLLITNLDGRYMGRVLSDEQPGPGCVEVRATPSRTDTVHVASRRYGPVMFNQMNGGVPYDTAYVDLTLPQTTSGARAPR